MDRRRLLFGFVAAPVAAVAGVANAAIGGASVGAAGPEVIAPSERWGSALNQQAIECAVKTEVLKAMGRSPSGRRLVTKC